MKNSDAASRTIQVQPSAFETITPSAKYSDPDRKPCTIPNSAGGDEQGPHEDPDRERPAARGDGARDHRDADDDHQSREQQGRRAHARTFPRSTGRAPAAGTGGRDS